MKDSILKEKQLMEKDFSSPPNQEWFDKYELPAGWSLIKGRLSGKTALDIGCASGWVAWHAQKEGANAIATDIFKTYVHPNLPFIIADKEDLPFKDSYFDFVLTSNTLHHGDLFKTCTEAYRVLKKDGEFISFIEPCISVEINEKDYLNQYCAKELASGIDERRPNLIQYQGSLAQFSSVVIYLSTDLSKFFTDTHVSTGICIHAVK